MGANPGRRFACPGLCYATPTGLNQDVAGDPSPGSWDSQRGHRKAMEEPWVARLRTGGNPEGAFRIVFHEYRNSSDRYRRHTSAIAGAWRFDLNRLNYFRSECARREAQLV